MNTIVLEATRKALNTRIRVNANKLKLNKEGLSNLKKDLQRKSHGVQHVGGGITASMEFNEESTARAIAKAEETVKMFKADIDNYTHALNKLENVKAGSKRKFDQRTRDAVKKALRVTYEKSADAELKKNFLEALNYFNKL